LSGCFYPQANKELDKLYFFNEPYHRIRIHSEDFNVYNSDSWWLPVGTGDIVIFPNNLGVVVANIEIDNGEGVYKVSKGIFLNEARIFGICKHANE